MRHVTWPGQPWSSVIRPQQECAPASPKGGAGSLRMEIPLRSGPQGPGAQRLMVPECRGSQPAAGSCISRSCCSDSEACLWRRLGCTAGLASGGGTRFAT